MRTKYLILALLALLASREVRAYDFCVGGIYYHYRDYYHGEGVTVTYMDDNYNSYSGNVTIPSNVIYNNQNWSVTSIGDYAFYYCQNLTSVTIPNSVTSIGINAFFHCPNLTSVTIPNSVRSIGVSAFAQCTGLTSINIPESVTDINDMAFAQCTGLTSVTIPNSVTSIKSRTFNRCSSLTSVTIPNSVTSIGYYAFANCTGLTSIDIPNSVTDIGSDAFYNTGWYNAKPDNSLVYASKVAYKYKGDMPSNTEIVIEDGTLGIAGEAFYGCTGLTSITIPNSVTSIGYSAFQGCSGLTSINIPESVTSIGNSAFYDCSGLTSVTIPNNVTSIEWEAFYNCYGLTSLTIPNSVTEIESYAFYGCSGLTSLTIPNSVTEIESYAFYGCSGLTSLTIPNSVTSINDNAFGNCGALTLVTTLNPTPITQITNITFGNCLNATLYVPYGSKAAYEAATYWQDFKEIIETNTVNVGSTGFATYCSPNALDFSGVTDIKAYVASDFDSGTNTLTLTRVTEVPAGEGLYIVGTAGSYEIPETTTDAVYSNLMKGVTRATTISPTDGSNTNFILSNGSHGVGFYTLSAEGELAGGKAYLQLPTASVAGVKALNLVFDDDATGIDFNPVLSKEERVIYNIAGQRVSKAQKGLYIIDGKKVFIK